MTKCLALAPRLETNHTEPARQQADARRQSAVTSGQPWTAVIDTPYSRYAEEIHAVKLAVGVNGSDEILQGHRHNLGPSGRGQVDDRDQSRAPRRPQWGEHGAVECDLRNPRLGRVFAVGEHAGLSEVIVNHATLDETMHKDDLTELMVLSAGDEPRFAHPSEILASEAIGGLFERLPSAVRMGDRRSTADGARDRCPRNDLLHRLLSPRHRMGSNRLCLLVKVFGVFPCPHNQKNCGWR